MTPVRAAEPSLADLEAAASKAAAEAAEARRIIDERRNAALARSDAAIEAWDRQHLASWDDEALAAEEAAARAEFVAAAEADPVLAAWVAYRAVRRNRIDLLGEMQSVINRYGINRRLSIISPGEEDMASALKKHPRPPIGQHRRRRPGRPIRRA